MTGPGDGRAYPASPSARDRWVVARRGEKRALDPTRPYAFLWEEESDRDGAPIPTATLFLTNRECPYRCVMCDLWRDTLDDATPEGAIPVQIDFALARLAPARQIKLYNAGNFFDRLAIPPADYDAIASRVSAFERVVVECHPSLVGDACVAFAERLDGRLEVAMGLETADPQALEKLNKRTTVDSFKRAADRLAAADIALRVFLLLAPPFVARNAILDDVARSLKVAFEAGAEVCSIVPTRAGNGAMEALAAGGAWSPPEIGELEAALEGGLAMARGRVYADLWDVERFFSCSCSSARAARIAAMTRAQRIVEPRVACAACGEAT